MGWPNTLCGYRSCRTHTYEKRERDCARVAQCPQSQFLMAMVTRGVWANWGIDRIGWDSRKWRELEIEDYILIGNFVSSNLVEKLRTIFEKNMVRNIL